MIRAAVLLSLMAATEVAAQVVAPDPPRPPRARAMSWSGGPRISSVWMHDGSRAPLLDSAKTAAFFTALSQTPASICEMAVDNLGNGWGWSDGQLRPNALRDQSRGARSEREIFGQARLAENGVAVAATALTLADACPRRAAARLLGQSELATASRALRDAARHSDGRVREAALLGIGIREDSANYQAAVKGIDDRDPEVVRMAAWALGEYERTESVPLLLPLLKRSEAGIRVAAAYALGEIEDPSAVPGLAALLKDESVEVRMAAVDALGSIEAPTVTPQLVLAMKDRDAEVRRRAAEALGSR